MGVEAISGVSRIIYITGNQDWVGVNGPIIDVRGMSSGAIYADHNEAWQFKACSGTKRDVTGAGPDQGFVFDENGDAILDPPISAHEWTKFSFRRFFFPFWQIVSVAPQLTFRTVIHLKR